jgi:hypothetical protein
MAICAGLCAIGGAVAATTIGRGVRGASRILPV